MSSSSPFLAVTGPQVRVVSPQTAIAQINATVQQLTQPGVSLQTETALEQQLVKQISAANPGANWGEIAVIALDLRDAAGSTAQINTDLQALYRLVQPTTSVSGLTATVGTIANLLRSTTTASTAATVATGSINTMVATTALAGATTLDVLSSSGLAAGNSVQIQLDTGQYFYDSIASITNNTLTLASALPAQSSNGNPVVGLPNGTTYFTTLNGAVAAGASSVVLASTAGMSIGDSIQFMLDSGTLFTTTITGITASSNTVMLAGTMLGAASSGNAVSVLTNPFTTANQTAASSSSSGGVTVTYFATLTATALSGATTLTLDTVGGMAAGDNVMVTLDSGTSFAATISSVSSSTSSVNLVQALPSQASTGNSFQDAVQLFATSTAFQPSTQMQSMLALQLNKMLSEANPGINLKTLQKDIAAFSGSVLTNVQFQQALTALNTLWTTGLQSSAKLSVLA
jgi:hypothetical protein